VQDHRFSIQQELVLPSTDEKTGIPQLGWLLSIPLSPFQAFEGVDKSAAAMREFALVPRFCPDAATCRGTYRLGIAVAAVARPARDRRLCWRKIDEQQTNTQVTLHETRQAIADARACHDGIEHLRW
jgi:hypothetical protein